MYYGGPCGGAEGAAMVTTLFLGTGGEPGVGSAATAEGLGGGEDWPVVQAPARQTITPTPRMRLTLTSMFLPLLTRLCSQSGSCESARRRAGKGDGPWRKRSRAKERARSRSKASGELGERSSRPRSRPPRQNRS